MVRRLGARARGGPACAPIASAISASSAASWSSPSMATVAPWSARPPAPCRRTRPAGGTTPICVPAAIAGAQDLGAERAAGVDHRLAAVHPEARGQRGDGVVGDGEDDQLDLLDEGLRLGERPATRRRARVNRSRRPASRLATAWIGQPARVRATPSAVPTAPAPTIPMTGGSPGSEWWWGCCVVARVRRRRRGDGSPAATGSRSMPAASMAASVVLAIALRIARRAGRPSALIGGRPRLGGGRGTLAPVECSERARTDAVVSDRPLRRPGAARPRPPRPLPAGRPRRTGSTSAGAPGHGQDPAREPAPPRRRRDRPARGRRDAGRLAAGRRPPRPRSRSCPRGSSSRT